MKYLFSPGCALFLYKQNLIDKTMEFLKKELGDVKLLTTCCLDLPEIPSDHKVIVACSGCFKRYNNYEAPIALSLWDIFAQSENIEFPDYEQAELSIIDTCPTRTQDKLHDNIRKLAGKMNLKLIEPEKTKRQGTCCGDSFYGKIPTEKVVEQMKIKADSMPCADILVYCISCSKSMFVGGKKPKYLLDLIYNEETIAKTFETDAWHNELNEFIAEHKELEII